MVVRILPVVVGAPADKVADAELIFEDGLLAGMKLVGFSLWRGKRREMPTISFPARQYVVNGERRSYALLRPIDGNASASPEDLRLHILRAYAEYENQAGLTFSGDALPPMLPDSSGDGPSVEDAPASADDR